MCRRICALLLAALLCLTAAGCGDGKTGPRQPDRETLPTEALPPQGSESTEPDAAEPSPTPAEGADIEPGSDAWIAWEDWYLAGRSLMEAERLGDLRLGLTTSGITELLGEPLEQTEPEYWGADGLNHMSWSYEGVTLSFAEESLEWITVTAPFEGKTQEGVGIGSGAAEIRAAYSELIYEETSTEERIVVGSDYGGLIFTLADGAVAAIGLGAAAE